MGPALTPLQLQLATPVRLLVLIGGGEFSFGETRAVDEFLLSRLTNKTIAFLPTASGSPEYASHLGKHFKDIDPSSELVNVPVYRGRDSRRARNLAQIVSAGMTYLGGGVTNNVVETIANSPADLAMREAASRGAVIAAIGASASAFGSFARDMRSAGSALAGLGWLSHTVVEAGFDPADDTALRRLMSIPEVKLGLGIPAGTALAVKSDGSTEIIGSGSVAVFRKG